MTLLATNTVGSEVLAAGRPWYGSSKDVVERRPIEVPAGKSLSPSQINILKWGLPWIPIATTVFHKVLPSLSSLGSVIGHVIPGSAPFPSMASVALMTGLTSFVVYGVEALNRRGKALSIPLPVKVRDKAKLHMVDDTRQNALMTQYGDEIKAMGLVERFHPDLKLAEGQAELPPEKKARLDDEVWLLIRYACTLNPSPGSAPAAAAPAPTAEPTAPAPAADPQVDAADLLVLAESIATLRANVTQDLEGETPLTPDQVMLLIHYGRVNRIHVEALRAKDLADILSFAEVKKTSPYRLTDDDLLTAREVGKGTTGFVASQGLKPAFLDLASNTLIASAAIAVAGLAGDARTWTVTTLAVLAAHIPFVFNIGPGRTHRGIAWPIFLLGLAWEIFVLRR